MELPQVHCALFLWLSAKAIVMIAPAQSKISINVVMLYGFSSISIAIIAIATAEKMIGIKKISIISIASLLIYQN